MGPKGMGVGFGFESQACQVFWPCPWPHGYTQGSHEDGKETQPQQHNTTSAIPALELEARTSIFVWLGPWAHGYPYGSHMEFLEAKPRADQASVSLALALEAKPSKSFGLTDVPMAILMATIWNSWKPSQEQTKPL